MEGVTTVMKDLRDELCGMLWRLRRVPLNRVARVLKGPGVYVFWADERLLRIGSTSEAPARIASNASWIQEVLADALAERERVKRKGACGHCGSALRETTPQYKRLVKRVRKSIRVSFIPESTIHEFEMGKRQFEGLLLWAATPLLNDPGEKDRLPPDNQTLKIRLTP